MIKVFITFIPGFPGKPSRPSLPDPPCKTHIYFIFRQMNCPNEQMYNKCHIYTKSTINKKHSDRYAHTRDGPGVPGLPSGPCGDNSNNK